MATEKKGINGWSQVITILVALAIQLGIVGFWAGGMSSDVKAVMVDTKELKSDVKELAKRVDRHIEDHE